jgi:2,5-diketo-D-gluconate reductase A
VLQRHAEAHGSTVAEVVLAWQLHAGVAVIPKASTRERLAQNLAAAELELTAAEIAAIDALADGTRTGEDPATYNGKGVPASAVPFLR